MRDRGSAGLRRVVSLAHRAALRPPSALHNIRALTFRDDALILSCALFVIPRPGCGVKSLLESLVSKMQEGSILYAEAVREFRKVFITSMLERHRGNQSRAARALGVHRNTLSRAMVELGIAARRARPASVHSVKAERRRA